MVSVTNNDIKLTRGDTATFKLNVKDLNNNNYDYSNDTVQFTVKMNTITTNAIIIKNVGSDGIIKINPQDTNNLNYGVYYYDIQIVKPNNDTYTVIVPHKFELTEEVTF